MRTRQEVAPKRGYNATPIKGRNNVADWDAVPDFSRLPDWTLLGISEVKLLTGLSDTAIGGRVKDGSFPPPGTHGKNRVWRLVDIRDWCNAVAGGEK